MNTKPPPSPNELFEELKMETRHGGSINTAGGGSEHPLPNCRRCGQRMVRDAQLSVRLAATSGEGTNLFRCAKCLTIACRDADGKDFKPTILTR